ncbi:MAG: LytR family transcriptional regulator [Pseudonocardiaceae bacterium]|nr:LytR family transcriptional regulator [Pseudonocardiaceae bacterium]
MAGADQGTAARRSRTGRLGLAAKRTGQSFLALLSVVVLGLTWYGWTMLGNLNEGFATTDVFDGDRVQPKPLDGAVDILLVGQDSRTDAQGNPLPQRVLDKLHGGEADGERQTDTMILVHIPVDGRRAVAISFPRDSWVELAGGYGTHKLNGAFVYAYNDTARELRQKGERDDKRINEQATVAGRKNLIATIEKLIGRPNGIDRYAEVNLGSFYEMTRAIGGISVCLNKATRDSKSGARFKKGKQTISGAKALAFVRQRYGLPRGDFDRIVRQQAFIGGLARKVLSQDMLTDPDRLARLSKAVQKSVVLSSGWNITEFAQQMQGLTGSNIKFHTIPNHGDAIIGGAAVVDVDEDEVRRFVKDLTSDGTSGADSRRGNPAGGGERADPRNASITVNVYNGSADGGIGTSVLDTLANKGFRAGDAVDVSSRASSVIRFPAGEEGNARLIADALGGDVAMEPDSDVESGTVRVLLGDDYPPPESSQGGSPGTPEPNDVDPNGTPDPNEQPSGQQSQQPSGQSSQQPSGQQPQQSEEQDEPDAELDAGEIPCVN